MTHNPASDTEPDPARNSDHSLAPLALPPPTLPSVAYNLPCRQCCRLPDSRFPANSTQAPCRVQQHSNASALRENHWHQQSSRSCETQLRSRLSPAAPRRSPVRVLIRIQSSQMDTLIETSQDAC